MRIAIDCADLDCDRIDGTRVYINNLLKWFGRLDQTSEFFLYHKNDYNPQLRPEEFSNYIERKIPYPCWWTQTRFAFELRKDRPDICWMPIQQIPLIGPKQAKYVVTIHDLAWKYFPDHFPFDDRTKLDFFTQTAVKKADSIIAISQSTKRDILKFYPKVAEEKITVVHHGFDAKLFGARYSTDKIAKVLKKYNIASKKHVAGVINHKDALSYSLPTTRYILYVGAIQPRKNLLTLIKAFEILKSRSGNGFNDLKLVLAGEPAWKAEETLDYIKRSSNEGDIIVTGKIGFSDLGALYQGAEAFVFPSLYEGFGIPVLEAFSSQIPVICAESSSLNEVGGAAACYFRPEDKNKLTQKLQKVLTDDILKKKMIERGNIRAQYFSWEKCAKETLKILKSIK